MQSPKIDFGGLTQMCWKSGRLHRSNGNISPERGARFQKDLKNYLFRYKKNPLRELGKSLDEYDFLPVNIELVASAPGFLIWQNQLMIVKYTDMGNYTRCCEGTTY